MPLLLSFNIFHTLFQCYYFEHVIAGWLVKFHFLKNYIYQLQVYESFINKMRVKW